VSGNELADRLIEQAMAQGAEIELDEVIGIQGEAGAYRVKSPTKEYLSKAVIIATGSHHRRLGIEGEERLTGEGISYCAVCDGAFYRGRTVAVIGGGNSALQDAILLSESCKWVYIVQNLAHLTGEERLRSVLAKKANVEVICSSVVCSLIGEDSLSAIEIESADSGERRRLDVDGMFVCIGQQPDNEAFASMVTLDGRGYVAAGEDCLTSSRGIFVAGDCRTKSIRQVTTATSDGAIAALAACKELDELA
jgi:thioredoxin reductase (NADPH)